MSRPPKRHRRSRVRRWVGEVVDVERGLFSARLRPVDHTGPELYANFELRHLSAAEPGVIFNLYVRRRGRHYRSVLREKDFGVWTQEELDAIKARAKALHERLMEVVD